MRRWSVPVIAALALAVGAFVVGLQVGSMGVIGLQPPVMVGTGGTGESVMTVEAAGVSYGFRDSVPWTDALGSFHDAGWPECLPKSAEVRDLRFRGGWVDYGGMRVATVLWVDCQGR